MEISKVLHIALLSCKSKLTMQLHQKIMATRRLLTCFTQAQQKALREAKERILLTEDVLIQKDRTIKSLQNKLKTMEAARAGTNIGHLSGSHSFFF